MDHGKTHSAYRWYVRQSQSADSGKRAGQGAALRVEYLCNAAYSRLHQADQAEWTLLE
jgi:hypothetical protein